MSEVNAHESCNLKVSILAIIFARVPPHICPISHQAPVCVIFE